MSLKEKMPQDAIGLSAGALALSTSAKFAALMAHLRRIGAVSEQAERAIYEDALLILREAQGADKNSLVLGAERIIEKQLEDGV